MIKITLVPVVTKPKTYSPQFVSRFVHAQQFSGSLVNRLPPFPVTRFGSRPCRNRKCQGSNCHATVVCPSKQACSISAFRFFAPGGNSYVTCSNGRMSSFWSFIMVVAFGFSRPFPWFCHWANVLCAVCTTVQARFMAAKWDWFFGLLL